MTLAEQLLPGDVLLYRGTGIYGWLIRRHTGHNVGHVEVYLGEGRSYASRNGQGVNFYDLRTKDLQYVCRPKLPGDLRAAMAWAKTQVGMPYGWLDLLAFIDVNIDGQGIVCSPAATLFERAAGLDPFNGEPCNKIAPFQFLTSNVYDIYEVRDGEVVRRDRALPAEAS